MLTPATVFGNVLVRRHEATGVFQFEGGVVAPEAESRKRMCLHARNNETEFSARLSCVSTYTS